METEQSRTSIPRIPKLCGADIELGNFILGWNRPGGSSDEASRALLREIRGLPDARRYGCADWSYASRAGWGNTEHYSCRQRDSRDAERAPFQSYKPQDWGRKFLPTTGGCCYIDLDHLEVCLPEVVSAWDHVAAWHAVLRTVRAALQAANRKQPPGRRLQVLVNNSDGLDNSYGSHLNFLITRRAWDNLFLRKMHHLLFLATYQVSSIIFTGQGKVGSENGAPRVRYQLSQRADFLENLVGPQTTFSRPIVNSRDEALCGRGFQGAERECARLHVIFHDSTLAHVASLLKVGVLQIILAMIEAERVDAALILDDPIDAVQRFSHDPSLQAAARLACGREVRALDLQFRFLERASSFVAEGGCDGTVPRAPEIISLWGDTLQKLQARDFESLARRLDWVLKQQALERAIAQRPGLGWDSPELKHLDHLYSNLEREEGLYWAFEESGFVEAVVTGEHIDRLMRDPPEDTRAWTRAMLLRYAGPEAIEDVDWDRIRFRITGSGYWPTYRSLDLAHPLRFTRREAAPLFERAADLNHLLNVLEAGGGGCPALPETTRQYPEPPAEGAGANPTVN